MKARASFIGNGILGFYGKEPESADETVVLTRLRGCFLELPV